MSKNKSTNSSEYTNTIELLNSDVIHEILYNSDDKDIDSFCKTNTLFYGICNDPFFWSEKFLRKYKGLVVNQDVIDYQKLYKSIYRLNYSDLLFYGIKHDYPVLINFILNNKIDWTQHNLDSSLIKVCYEGNLEVVKFLIEKGANVNYGNDYDAGMAIKGASRSGHLDILKYLLEKGASLEDLDEDILVITSKAGHSELVSYLLGPPLYISTRISRALVVASENGHLDIVKLLIQTKSRI